MGLPRVKQLSDLARLGADLTVTCGACGCACVYAVDEVVRYFHQRNWNTAWETVAARFRCGCCGARRALLGRTPKLKNKGPRWPAPIARSRPTGRPTR